jgi:hypothetical protein
MTAGGLCDPGQGHERTLPGLGAESDHRSRTRSSGPGGPRIGGQETGEVDPLSSPSGARPVDTSDPQFGHLAVSTLPTMKVNSQTGQETRGAGGSGGRGGGGVELVEVGGAAGLPGAALTMLTEPQTGHENRPGPGTSNCVRQEPQRTITRLTLLLLRRLLRWTVDR